LCRIGQVGGGDEPQLPPWELGRGDEPKLLPRELDDDEPQLVGPTEFDGEDGPQIFGPMELGEGWPQELVCGCSCEFEDEPPKIPPNGAGCEVGGRKPPELEGGAELPEPHILPEFPEAGAELPEPQMLPEFPEGGAKLPPEPQILGCEVADGLAPHPLACVLCGGGASHPEDEEKPCGELLPDGSGRVFEFPHPPSFTELGSVAAQPSCRFSLPSFLDCRVSSRLGSMLAGFS